MLRRERRDARVSVGCGLLFLKLKMSHHSQLIIQEQDMLELQQSVTKLTSTLIVSHNFKDLIFFYIYIL